MTKKNNVKDAQLILVDGSSYLYRAYHALPDMSNNAANLASGALYGMISMFKKIRRDYPYISHGACIFDAPGGTFRSELYPEYKANRPSMPDDLRAQISDIHQVIIDLGWPVLKVEKVEADDVIGTLTKHALREGLQVLISTGDKDMAQLVQEHVCLLNTMNYELLDIEGVFKKFSVYPEQIVDYLALIGDVVDNVPGVKKVGPKTASKWLTKYQSLEGILAAIDEIPGIVGKNLKAAVNWLPTAKKLLTIKCDCDLPTDLIHKNSILHEKTALKLLQPDKENLFKIYQKYNFRKWLGELQEECSGVGFSLTSNTYETSNIVSDTNAAVISYLCQKQEDVFYTLLVNLDDVKIWVDKINESDLTAFDIVSTSQHPMQAEIVGFAFAVASGQACYIPVGHQLLQDFESQLTLYDVLKLLKCWIENPKKLKLGKNLKHSKHVLLNYQINLAGIAHDIILESYILESHRRHDIRWLAQQYLNFEIVEDAVLYGKGKKCINFDSIDLQKVCRHASEGVDLSLKLHQVLYKKLSTKTTLCNIYENIEIPLISVLTDMERTGVKIDVDLLQIQSISITERLQNIYDEACEEAQVSFNLNSPKQIGEILFQKLALPVIKKTKQGVPSTDDSVLKKLALHYKLPKLLLKHRALSKLTATYLDKLPHMVDQKTGRLHTSYGQTVAVTGRLTSNEPNLQNIPVRTEDGRRIREAFVPTSCDYKILSADYSQIELRIMAHLSQDDGLISAFNNCNDVHSATAAEIFSLSQEDVTRDQRRVAKIINFGLIYGMSAFGLANNLGITHKAAKQYIHHYFSRYPKVALFMDRTRSQAKSLGFVETIFGRKLWLPEINSGNSVRRQAAERAAINAPMQGTAADVIKLSMVAIDQWLRKNSCRSRMIMQVHDELVFEVAKAEINLLKTELPRLMCQVIKLHVPLCVDIGIGDNWDAAH